MLKGDIFLLVIVVQVKIMTVVMSFLILVRQFVEVMVGGKAYESDIS